MNKVMRTLLITSIISIFIASLWNQIPVIKDTAHLALDPTIGALLNWNALLGFILIAMAISIFTMLLQKYTTDQEMLKKIKQEQKLLQEEMKKFKDHPEKLMELNKKQLELMPKTMEITMRPTMYTFIPMILLFRWFSDYFTVHEVKFFGLSWFWAYLIMIMVFSILFRKAFNVA
jgi:uncharacterized membrane protein (DUF106 family)